MRALLHSSSAATRAASNWGSRCGFAAMSIKAALAPTPGPVWFEFHNSPVVGNAQSERLQQAAELGGGMDSKRRRRIAQRALLFPSAYHACLIDAAGTLLVPSESTADVYHRYAAKYNTKPPSKLEILDRFRRAYNKPWGRSTTRYVGDGRVFWSHIVQESTGVTDPAMFEELYKYYERAEAWTVAPGALAALQRMRDAGVALAVVSNFDTRLRPLLDALHLNSVFDEVVVSAEVGWEKPNRCIFEAALDALGVAPQDAVHVGDDRRNDVWGARDAGVHAWLWGDDITSFDQLAYRVLNGSKLEVWDNDGNDGADEQEKGQAVRPDT